MNRRSFLSLIAAATIGKLGWGQGRAAGVAGAVAAKAADLVSGIDPKRLDEWFAFFTKRLGQIVPDQRCLQKLTFVYTVPKDRVYCRTGNARSEPDELLRPGTRHYNFSKDDVIDTANLVSTASVGFAINSQDGAGGRKPIPSVICYEFNKPLDIVGIEMWSIGDSVVSMTVEGSQVRTGLLGDVKAREWTIAAKDVQTELQDIKEGDNSFDYTKPYRFKVSLLNAENLRVTFDRTYLSCGGYAICRLFPIAHVKGYDRLVLPVPKQIG